MHDEKRHYKMYKDGKQWVFAAIVTFTFTLAPMAMTNESTAKAATTDSVATTQQTNSQASSASSVTLKTTNAAASASNTAVSGAAGTAASTAAQNTATTASSTTSSAAVASTAASNSASANSAAPASQVSADSASASQTSTAQSTAAPASAVSSAASTAAKTAEATSAATSADNATASDTASQKTLNMVVTPISVTGTTTTTSQIAHVAKMAVNTRLLAATTENSTADTFSVKDPEYPSTMYVDPDASHYTFFWAVSRDNRTKVTGEYSIVLSTDRTGKGILYVTILDANNNVLNKYTINSGDYRYDVRAGTSWLSPQMGRIYNDDYSGVIRNLDSQTNYDWSPRFNINQGGGITDQNYYTVLSFMIPKKVTQTTTYVDDNGNQISDSHVQEGMSGQIYTTTGGKVVNGYYETIPANHSGYMSQFGKIGETYTKDWHTGDKVIFTQIKEDGTMKADYYYNNRLINSYTLTPSGSGSSVTIDSQGGGHLTIYNIYIPQTQSIQYVYKKMGKLIITSNDSAFDSSKKTSTQYANDPSDATAAADVTLPKIDGFVPFINGVAVTDYTFNPTKYVTALNQDITVVYRAKQKARIDFIDADSNNKVIASSGTLTDYDGNPINYSTADQLKQLIYDAKTNPNGKYDLVKDGFPSGAVYDSNANADQVYQVVLKHHHETINGTSDPANGQKTIKRTIDYYYNGDGKAAESVTQSVTFTRTGDEDMATGKITWQDWSQVASQTVAAVTSPTINGYTADQKTVAALVIKPTDKDTTVTVKYYANTQKVKLIYHDDTDNKDISVKEFSGESGADSGRTTAEQIEELEKLHLKLVSDETNGQNIVFDKDDSKDQVYTIHLAHEMESTERSVTVTEQIEHHKAIKQPDGTTKYFDIKDQIPIYNASLTFKETGTHDLYNDTYTWNNDWTKPQTFATVKSPTLKGYTPDVSVVNDGTITITDQNYEQAAGGALNVHHDIIYVGKNQIAVVNFIDDTTGKTLETWQGTGQSGQTLDYTTNDTIQKYIKQHYLKVSDATNGQRIVLDEDDVKNNQIYEVHLKHATKSTSRSMTVTEKISLVYQGDANHKDGTLIDSLSPNPITATLTFTQDGETDLVTNQTTWNADWQQTQEFAAVTAPTLKGYTTSVSQISAKSVTMTNQTFDQAGKTLTYTIAYTPVKQTAIIKYVDGSDGDKLLYTDTQTGLTDQKIDYSSQRAKIMAQFANYSIASDGTKDGTKDETKDGITFNDNQGLDQVFTIVLNHNTESATRTATATRTIHFVYKDGTTAKPDQVQTLTFTQTGTKDLVTGITTWDDSYSDTQSFDEVSVDAISGYSSSVDSIAAQAVTMNNGNFANQTFEETVTYLPKRQYIAITYYDDTTGKTLSNKVLNGYSNENANYSTKDQIAAYESQGFVLVSDDTNGAALTFNSSDNSNDQVYAVHLKHGTKTVSRNKTVVEEIIFRYAKDGSQAAPMYSNSLTFTQTGTQDLVTKSTTWDDTAEQTFALYVSPTITGYHSDYAQEPEHTLKITSANFDQDLDIKRTVTYYADDQKVAVVYVDKKTNNVLATDSLTGKTGDKSVYDAQSFIEKNIKNYQYYLISENQTKDGIEFPNDGSLTVYYVYLTHQTENVSRSEVVEQIIHYQSTDGYTLQDDTVIKNTAVQKGTHDLVDGSYAWDAWQQASFDAVTAPAFNGYDAGKPNQINAETSQLDNDTYQDGGTVVLEHTILYVPHEQKATVVYYDDTTGKQISSQNLTGNSKSDSGYSTTDTINKYRQLGYDLVNDPTNSEEIVFDADDSQDQIYTIHLKHRTASASRKLTIKRTIHYVYGDGVLAGQTAKADVEQTLTFNQTGTQDLVTKNIVWDSVASQAFDAVSTPSIKGYTADPAAVEKLIESPDNGDFEQGTIELSTTVTYQANEQTVKVYYIDGDKPTDSQLASKEFSGLSGTDSGHSTKAMIASLEALNYKLLSDQTKGATIIYDYDDADQVYYVYFGHQTQADQRTKDVTETIDYVIQNPDGSYSQAFDPNSQTLHFEQTGVKDLVTGITDWNGQWTSKQSFSAVKSPAKSGYHAIPDQIGVVEIEVNNDNFDENQNVAKQVVYVADPQSAYIEYFDQDNGVVIGEDQLHGVSNADSGYTTAAKIAALKAKGYELVKDETGGTSVIFNDQDDVSQTYVVYFKHRHDSIARTLTVNDVIHFKYKTGPHAGQTADGDYIDLHPATFTQTGYRDAVTGDEYYDQDFSGEAAFGEHVLTHGKVYDAIARLINGYHLSINQIGAHTVKVSDGTFDKATKHQDGSYVFNHEHAVYYIADTQTAYIEYVDDDQDQQVITIDKTQGLSDTDSTYSSKDRLKDLIYDAATNPNGQYDLVSDGTKDGIHFNTDEHTDQYFVVHLKHHIQKAAKSRTKTIHQTIRYQYADGTMAAENYEATPMTFTQTGDLDMVTGDVDWNGAWTTDDSRQGKFVEIDSPTIAGYTPDIATVSHEKIVMDNSMAGSDLDMVDVVTYNANAQKVVINYVDADNDDSLIAQDEVNGKTNETINYDTSTQLAKLVYDATTNPNGQYVLAGDEFAEALALAKAQGLQLVYAADGNQSFTVYLRHHYSTVLPDDDPANGIRKIAQIIQYYYQSDHSKAANSDIQVLTFKRTGLKDDVTGKVYWQSWASVAPQMTKAVVSPVIAGYTVAAGQETIAANEISPTLNKDTFVYVYYTADPQTAVINYVDDDQNQRVVQTDTTQGPSNTKSNYSAKDALSRLIYDAITNPNGQYDLVSDGTSNGIVFDADDGMDQTYVVHLKHHILKAAKSRTKTIHQTIHYQFADGSRAHADYEAVPMTFTQTGDLDMVTGSVDWNGAWTTSDLRQGEFDSVDVPTIAGYTPNVKTISHEKLVMDNAKYGANLDLNDVVIYTADPQAATIEYIDQNTGQMIASETVNGTTKAKINYSTQDLIKQLIAKGYELVSDDFATAQQNGSDRFDDDDQVTQTFKVVFKHGTQTIDPSQPSQDQPTTPGTPINPDDPTGPAWPAKDEYDHTSKAVVHYQDENGNAIAADSIQTAHWTRKITIDRVTGTIIAASDWQIDPDAYQTVEVPTIAGYQPSQTSVSFAMQPDDQAVTVIYAKKATPDQPSDSVTPVDPNNGHDHDNITQPDSSDNAEALANNQNGNNTQSDRQNDQADAKSVAKLPQTGNDQHSTWRIMGLLAAIIGWFGMLNPFKKRD